MAGLLTPGMERPVGGLRGEVRDHVKRSVRSLLVDILGDQLLHAEIAAAGAFRFPQVFAKDMAAFFRGNAIFCDQLADVVHAFACGQWRTRYPDLTPGQFLDRVRIVAPPTQQEIDEAWTVDIGSSEQAMRQYWDGSARTRTGRMEELGIRTTTPEPES